MGKQLISSSHQNALRPVRDMIFSTILFTIMGVAVKFSAGLPFYYHVFYRGFIGLIITYFWCKNKKISIWGNNPRTLTLRGLFGTVSLFLYFYILKKMDFAIAVTLQYLSPVFTVILVSLLVKERFHWKRFIYVLLSFLGVIFVHGFQSYGTQTIYIFCSILSAIFAALAYATIRYLKNDEHSLVITWYFCFFITISSLPLCLIDWVWPTWSEFGCLLLIGITAQLAQYFLTLGYQRGEVVAMANISYLNIVWSFLAGYLFWGELMGIEQLFGAVLIVGSAIVTSIKIPYRK